MPDTQVLVLDTETFYDSEYSLTQMTPPEYILDGRFECTLLTVKDLASGKPAYAVDGPDVGYFFKQQNPEFTVTVTFNALFDNCIYAWRYGWVPSLMLDAMGMARALRGHLLTSASLRNVAKLLGCGEKGDEIVLAKGKRRVDLIREGSWNRYVNYGLNDTELTARIFDLLLPEFPYSERKVMDRVLRAAIQPRLRCDVNMLRQHLVEVRAQKEAAINTAGVDRSELNSTAKFSALLTALGVEVDTKISATGNEIPALAKTDEFMQGLLEHDDPRVQALASARLGVKSTIEETRGEKLLAIGSLPWQHFYCDSNSMPIPLAYGKPHTHRLSGDWGINMQNLPSGRNAPSKLRHALIAPPGSKVLVADFAQIEARVTAWLCRQLDLIAEFEQADKLAAAGDKNPPDPYKALASLVFGFDVTDKKSMERFIGKTGVLGLGYRCGATKFYNMVVSSARLLGADLSKLGGAGWTEDLAEQTKDIYRTKNKNIENMWFTLDRVIANHWANKNAYPWHLERDFEGNNVIEVGYGYVKGPNNLVMRYQPLGKDDNGNYLYRYGKFVRQLHGGSFLENIVQFLSRIVATNAMLRLWDRGLHFVLQAHDELVFVVKDAEVEQAKKIVIEEMCRRPSWAPSLPLSAEAGVGQSYGEAK